MKIAEPVSEPIVNQANTIETNAIETVTTTTEVIDMGETVQTIQTHEIKNEITSEPEAASNADIIDSNKLSEPENSEMTGKIRSRNNIHWNLNIHFHFSIDDSTSRSVRR